MLVTMLAVSASLSTATPPQTDFGVRIVGVPAAPARATEAMIRAIGSGRLSLSAATTLGAKWGNVTSTYRSPEHNRRVGGVRNSFHLSGRAIDIARRGGVQHSAIEAAYRRAGYRIVESLDEGDHSHFAFSFGPAQTPSSRPVAKDERETTQWKIVFAPR